MPGLMPAGLEQTAQHGDQDVAGGRRAIQRMIDGLAARQGHEAAGQFLGGNGRRPSCEREQSFQQLRVDPSLVRHQRGVGPAEFRIARGQQLQLGREQCLGGIHAEIARPVLQRLEGLAEVLARRGHRARDAFGFLRLVLAQQVQQQVFLALEIGVEGALGIAGLLAISRTVVYAKPRSATACRPRRSGAGASVPGFLLVSGGVWHFKYR